MTNVPASNYTSELAVDTIKVDNVGPDLDIISLSLRRHSWKYFFEKFDFEKNQ